MSTDTSSENIRAAVSLSAASSNLPNIRGIYASRGIGQIEIRPLEDYEDEYSTPSVASRRTTGTRASESALSSDDNYTPIPSRSPTLDLSSDQLLASISSMIQRIFSENVDRPVDYGLHIKYTPRYFRNIPAVINCHNLIFEINQVSFVEVAVEKIEQDPISYNVKLYYNNPGFKQNKGIISQAGLTVSDAFKAAVERARKIRLCYTCSIPYDSEVSEYCPCCLLSDFFTYNNKLITCAICQEKTKDFKTLGCGHMFHITCLSKVKKATCPCCRTAFSL